MGHLLSLIVERNRPATGLMISALVTHLDANDAGPGFYALAQQLGDLPRGASASAKFDFWVGQVKSVHRHYPTAQDITPSAIFGPIPGKAVASIGSSVCSHATWLTSLQG